MIISQEQPDDCIHSKYAHKIKGKEEEGFHI